MWHSVLSWPKLLGALAAGVGLSGMLSESELFIDTHGLWSSPDYHGWAALIGYGLLLILSYPLAVGRNWARRLLLFVVACSGAVLLAQQGRFLFAEGAVTHLSPEQAKPIIRMLWFKELSVFVLLFTVSAFAVLLLCHRDVVEAFNYRALSNNQSN